MNADNGSPSHSTTSHYLHRTADAPPYISNCPTQSSGKAMELICQRRSTVVRRITGSSALGQLYEESERGRSRDVGAVNVGAGNVPGGAIHNLLPHARTADERGELRGLFDGNRCGAIDPTAVRQDAAVHIANGSNPAGCGDSGVAKDCGAIGEEADTPLRKEEMNQVIRSRTDWKERVVFRLAWITASRWSEIAALTAKNFKLKADGNIISDWSVAPKTAKADPHRASRFVKIRGQDAFDIIKLCRTLQEKEKLTNLTTAQVERALAPWNATAHSTKRGALRHAAQIVETDDLDPHVISLLAKHVDPFDLPQNTVRYLWRYTAMLTKVSSPVALM
ncbi:hypothetical protein TcG_04305 [Trypanosoma cruzi]|uniref:Trans-sialidase n=1 Tax=Trypanosoma cruzi Dm28c TaxID=1416333 RepID=V5B0M8_TRYCR|nr:hypothetical protein TCDM_11381 [Trypanosoma cruzi Dm28c]RNF19451.1 hypothetical protein TcG_04305 [Trypanosoma cruzi]